jgi:thiol-disulfide isomerase/thioredoxin
MTNTKWLGVVLAIVAATARSAVPQIQVGDAPPDYLGKNAEGVKINVSDLRGKVVVISFFATWCGPCRNEVPILAKIQKAAGRDKLVIVAIDFKEDSDVVRKVRRIFKDYDITFTHDSSGAIGAKFGVSSIPHMVIVGADGKVAEKHI